MKKKLFLVTLCLLLTVVCLTGCAVNTKFFEKINKLLDADYSKLDITVTVSDVDDVDELISEFNVEYGANDTSKVNFNIRRLATIPSDGTIPDSYIKTYQGSATVTNNQVVSVSGDVPQDVKLEDVADCKLKFSDKYFANVKVTDNTLTAKVTKPQGFLGQANFTCKEDTMVVSVEYGEFINSIRIQYVSVNGSTVALMYTFTA